MKRLLSAFPALLLATLCLSCGNVFIGGAIHPAPITVTGTVSFIQVSTIESGGTVTQVTFVTFFASGATSSIGFCGNQSSQFPLNQTVTMNFNPGQPCATLLLVVIIT